MDLVVRAAVAFLFIWTITRIVGRRELSSLQPFDVILLVVLGDLIEPAITQNDHSMTGAVLVIGTFALLTVGMSYLSFRVRRLRPVLEGEPLVLIENGTLIERNLRRERLTVDEVATEARLNQIDDLANVRFAVLETNGRISFLT